MATTKKSTKKSTAKTDAEKATPDVDHVVTPDEAINDPAFLKAAKDQPAPVITAPVPSPTDPLAGMPTIAVLNADGVPVPVAYDPADQVIAADKEAAKEHDDNA